MTRRLLLTAIVLAASAPVAAQQTVGPPWPAESWQPASTTIFAVEPPPAMTTFANTSVAAPVEPAAYDVTFNLAGDSPAGKSVCDFRSVCDCGCGIECLDTWCDCEQPCCTTDQWCCHPCQCSQGNCYLTPEGCWVANDCDCDIWGYPTDVYKTALRFGGWGVSTQGSLNKIGEYQDLRSSAFWDLDAISSNGDQTLDIVLSGLDNEANNAQAYYYGPGVTAKVRYDRYLRRWDHDPLQGFPRPPIGVPPPSNHNVIVEDLNVGEDYAIRVNQLDARFQGRISDNSKWRLNVWGMRKFGERQSNAVAHCFNVNDNPATPAQEPPGATGNVCHVLSQRQNIDWTTMEIQPVVEFQFNNVSVEYSHTFRGFGQSDQLVDRQYTRFSFNPLTPAGPPQASGTLGEPFIYAFVPESTTHIDRLKANVNLTDTQQIYANLYIGNTNNEFRDTDRRFGGYDVRFTDRSFDTLTSTAYVSMYEENNELPPFFFNSAPFSPNIDYDEDSARHPVDYNRFRAGLKGNWRPSSDPTNGLRVVGGYEYYELSRDFAVYPVDIPPSGTFSQADTKTHMIEIGPDMRWSPTRTTYVRYRVRFIEDPLIGVRESNGRFNSNQPEQDHRIELGGTWSPANNLSATAQISFVNAWHQSQFANFSEDSYPLYFTLWYAPTDRVSLTGGYAYFSNWIDQDITLGFQNAGGAGPTETTRWNYSGENHLVNANISYLWTEDVTFTAGYEWNRGNNSFVVPPSIAGADWSQLASFSDVIIETQRATLGADWQPYDNLTVYVRYVYYDWNDIGAGLDSGTAHMGLGGASLIW